MLLRSVLNSANVSAVRGLSLRTHGHQRITESLRSPSEIEVAMCRVVEILKIRGGDISHEYVFTLAGKVNAITRHTS